MHNMQQKITIVDGRCGEGCPEKETMYDAFRTLQEPQIWYLLVGASGGAAKIYHECNADTD